MPPPITTTSNYAATKQPQQHRASKAVTGAISSAVGISNLPNQRHRIVSKRGIDFTILVCGESGLGKSTFISNLVTIPIIQRKDTETRFNISNVTRTVTPRIYKEVLEEKGFIVRLGVIDTPGFGDFVNNTNCWDSTVKLIDGLFEKHFGQVTLPTKRSAMDCRVHACLYFLPPNGRTLRPLDVAAMKEISTRANLIPVIGKSDLLTRKDLMAYKQRVREALESNDIKVFTIKVESDDEETTFQNESIMKSMPFAVVASDTDVITRDGHKVKGRQYPWGYVEVENEDHSDFKKLRNLLIRTHLDDLIETTDLIHYEQFCRRRNPRITSINTQQQQQQQNLQQQGSSSPTRRLKEEEEELRRRFADQVKAEEARFRTWEQRLIAERDRLNKELEREHDNLKRLQESVAELIRSGSGAVSPTPGPGATNSNQNSPSSKGI